MDSDPTFYFDADPDPDPDPAQVLHMFENLKFLHCLNLLFEVIGVTVIIFNILESILKWSGKRYGTVPVPHTIWLKWMC